MLGTAVSASPQRESSPTLSPEPESTPAQFDLDLPPLQGATGTLAPPTSAPASAPVAATQGQAVQAAPLFDPRLGLPLWLRSTRDIALWSDANGEATALGSLPAGTSYVKPLGA